MGIFQTVKKKPWSIGTIIGSIISVSARVMDAYNIGRFLKESSPFSMETWFIIGLCVFFISTIGLLWPLISGQDDKDRKEIERLRADNECWKEGIRFSCEKELRELNSSFSIYDKIVSQVDALRKERERKG